MSDSLRESMSALMDGEASEMELRRLLKEDSSELREQWTRQHLTRSALRDEAISPMKMDLQAAVRSAIDEEDVHSAAPTGWRRQLASVAVAASVAAVVVFGVNGWQGLGQNDAPAMAAAPVSAPADMGAAVGSVTASANGGAEPQAWDTPMNPERKARFDSYLRRHTEGAVYNSGPGMMSWARVVSQQPAE